MFAVPVVHLPWLLRALVRLKIPPSPFSPLSPRILLTLVEITFPPRLFNPRTPIWTLRCRTPDIPPPLRLRYRLNLYTLSSRTSFSKHPVLSPDRPRASQRPTGLQPQLCRRLRLRNLRLYRRARLLSSRWKLFRPEQGGGKSPLLGHVNLLAIAVSWTLRNRKVSNQQLIRRALEDRDPPRFYARSPSVPPVRITRNLVGLLPPPRPNLPRQY